MGIFGKSQAEKWLDGQEKKHQRMLDDGCEHFGTLIAMASLEPSPYAILYDDILEITFRYFLQADGLIHLCGIKTPDEFDGLKVNSWGLGYAEQNPNMLYFRCDFAPWVFKIHAQSKGDAINWFKKNYKHMKKKMG